jgi:hypothetical protein
VDPLFDEHILLEFVLAALEADSSRPEDFRQEAIRLAQARGNPSAPVLNEKAWNLVDPDREDEDTDVALALRLTRLGIELAPEDSSLRDTHAWALFANGLHDEALIESARALELAPEDEKDDYQGYLDRMRAMIEEAQASAPEDN